MDVAFSTYYLIKFPDVVTFMPISYLLDYSSVTLTHTLLTLNEKTDKNWTHQSVAQSTKISTKNLLMV